MSDDYKTVLIVEDESTFRHIVAKNLRARGLEVTEAEGIQGALSYLRHNLPHLMLLDISLPDGSGWDLLRQMRALNKSIPTIIVSAVRVSQDRLDEFKPLAYLPKPFPLEALLRLVTDREGAAA
jgi:DNA-binding response OmpR family regulator